MPLDKEEREALFRIDAKIKEYEDRGCSKAMDAITKVSVNLDKNTREHIFVKGFLKASGIVVIVGGGIVTFFRAKIFGG